MLKLYRVEKTQLAEVDAELSGTTLKQIQWIDLCDATVEEKQRVEDVLGIDVDPVNDYEPYQVSSHFSATEHQLTMTGLLLTLHDDDPHLVKITFIRARGKLITVSDGQTSGLTGLIKECENCFSRRSGRDDIFAAILDMIVDHTDNILDKIGHDLESINDMVFQHHVPQIQRRLLRSSPRKRNRQLEHILTEIGPTREALVKLRRSVLSFRRMIAFLREQDSTKNLMPKLKAFEHDLKSIDEAEADMSATAGFLLDGVIGYIGLLQNKVMNILTLISVILSPAMVVGAIYGMNFKIMPELQWTYGYPFALGLIVASTVGLYVWVRQRGL